MDVIKSMESFIKISQICGLFPYRLRKSNGFYFLEESRLLLRYSKVLYWFLTFAEGSTIISLNFTVHLAEEISMKVVIWLSTMTLYVSFIIIFRTIVKKHGVLCFWINQFNNLWITCPAKSDYNKVERFNRYLLLLSTSYFVVVVATKYLTYEETFHQFFADFIFFTRLWVIHLFLKHFVVFVNCIRCFYAVMRTSLAQENTLMIPRSWVKLLRELRSKDLFVKDFVEVLHSIYMPVLFVQLIWFLATLLCDITVTGRAGMPTMMQVDWMCYICLETVLYITICHVTENEAKKAICCLQDFFITLDDPEVLYEVELFSLQLQHMKLNFNALGFFKLSNNLLYSMIGETTTYTVILLQFQSNYKSIQKAFGTNSSLSLTQLMKLQQSHEQVNIKGL